MAAQPCSPGRAPGQMPSTAGSRPTATVTSILPPYRTAHAWMAPSTTRTSLQKFAAAAPRRDARKVPTPKVTFVSGTSTTRGFLSAAICPSASV